MTKIKLHIDTNKPSEEEVLKRKNFKQLKSRFDAHYRYKNFSNRFYKDYKYRVVFILLLLLLVYWLMNE